MVVLEDILTYSHQTLKCVVFFGPKYQVLIIEILIFINAQIEHKCILQKCIS